MELGSRLNVITGDNGLGKSFLLDVAWWALTQTWLQEINPALTSGYVPRPSLPSKAARITFGLKLEGDPSSQEVSYGQRQQAWLRQTIYGNNPGIVIYALADGGFAVWDPARNAGGIGRVPIAGQGGWMSTELVPAYVFSTKEIWDGLRVLVDGKPTVVCNGLLADWTSWIRERGTDAKRMTSVLAKLAPTVGATTLEVSSEFARVSVNDVRDIPLLSMGYGQDVPILYASLGVRRIAALAYVMSWAWREHVIAANQLGVSPSTHVVLLFDELEAHLHPLWQRAIAPALLEIATTLTDDVSSKVQLIATTHSPLVLASLEPVFDETTDKLFTLEQAEGRKGRPASISLHEQVWAKQGDVVNWLVSGAFGLKQGRSLEAERAIEAAEAWMRKDLAALPADLKTQARIHAELQRTLAGHDEFWPRWIVSELPRQPEKAVTRTPAKAASRAPAKTASRAPAKTASRTSAKKPASPRPPAKRLPARSGRTRRDG